MAQVDLKIMVHYAVTVKCDDQFDFTKVHSLLTHFESVETAQMSARNMPFLFLCEDVIESSHDGLYKLHILAI